MASLRCHRLGESRRHLRTTEVSINVSNTFKRVQQTCGISAAMIGAGYLVAATIAMSDAPGDIVIPPEVNLFTAVTIVSAVVLGVASWLIETGNRMSAQRDVAPLVRAEVERAINRAGPAIASAVLDEMSTGIDSRIGRIADTSAARTAGRLQEIVTGEIMADVINAAVARAHRSGMVMQAQSVVPRVGATVTPLHATITSSDN